MCQPHLNVLYNISVTIVSHSRELVILFAFQFHSFISRKPQILQRFTKQTNQRYKSKFQIPKQFWVYSFKVASSINRNWDNIQNPLYLIIWANTESTANLYLIKSIIKCFFELILNPIKFRPWKKGSETLTSLYRAIIK